MQPSLKLLASGILLLSWFVTLFMSQVSSPNYRALFWWVLPFAVTHLALVVCFFTRTRGWKQWLLACFSALSLLSFVEMSSRVWFHVRLF
jgi:hypothetical protein